MVDAILNYGIYIIAGLVLSFAFYKNRGRDFEVWETPFNIETDYGTPFGAWAFIAVMCSFSFMLLTLLFLSLSGNL